MPDSPPTYPKGPCSIETDSDGRLSRVLYKGTEIMRRSEGEMWLFFPVILGRNGHDNNNLGIGPNDNVGPCTLRLTHHTITGYFQEGECETGIYFIQRDPPDSFTMYFNVPFEVVQHVVRLIAMDQERYNPLTGSPLWRN